MSKVSHMSVDNDREILLRAEGISKDYVESGVVTHVLKGVDLDIYTNEMVAVIGSSGSGKSTLLHILGTLDKPSRGSVYFKGDNLFKLSSRRRDYFRNHSLGFVYQFHHLLSDFTAYENVAFPLMISGEYTKKQIDDRVRYLLDRVGLAHRMNHRSSELSGGERQRVAIARAIANKPELILADEPTGNLDFRSAGEVFSLLSELREENRCSMLVVTHDRDLASRFERTCEMSDGLIKVK